MDKCEKLKGNSFFKSNNKIAMARGFIFDCFERISHIIILSYLSTFPPIVPHDSKGIETTTNPQESVKK